MSNSKQAYIDMQKIPEGYLTEKFNGRDGIRFFTGPYGTAIFEDTLAYHTARPVESGFRHML
jgi:hypothetical protein